MTLPTKIGSNVTLAITESERAGWARHFACLTPDKIRVHQPFGNHYECRGCPGNCGSSHFTRETPPLELKQPELLPA